jgi:thiazole synthase
MSASEEARREGGDDPFVIAERAIRSRLIVGTGKYKDFAETREATLASGAEVVTVAVRRTNITDSGEENLLDYLPLDEFLILPNTAGCYSSDEAVRYARLAREAGVGSWVKLEVIGDEKTLFPDIPELLKAAEILVKDDFIVLPYTSDDPVTAKRLEDLGCATVMPLAAPIGSGLGIRNPYNIRIIQETVGIPVIVDAGVGVPSDAARVMEMGVDGVLMNSAIAGADDPIRMARAMKHAVEAGRLAYLAGRIPRRLYASASTTIEGMLD